MPANKTTKLPGWKNSALLIAAVIKGTPAAHVEEHNNSEKTVISNQNLCCFKVILNEERKDGTV
jgi:hypothetical protein